jgi:hypothetical protein
MRDAGLPLWDGTGARDGKGAEMLRIDLEAAGIPFKRVRMSAASGSVLTRGPGLPIGVAPGG